MPFQVISRRELRVSEERILYLMPPEHTGVRLRDEYKNRIKMIAGTGEKRIVLALEKTDGKPIGKEGFSDLFEAIDEVLETEDLLISFVMEQPVKDTYLDKAGKELRGLFSEKADAEDFRYEMPMFSSGDADEQICLDREGVRQKGQKRFGNTSLFSEPRRTVREGTKIRKLQDLFQKKEETFQQMLLRLIAEKKLTNTHRQACGVV